MYPSPHVDYDPTIAPDPDEWNALDHDERIAAVVEYHRREESANLTETQRRKLALFEAERDRPKDIPAAAKPKLGRNAPCWCGSGKKYKRCHWDEDRSR